LDNKSVLIILVVFLCFYSCMIGSGRPITREITPEISLGAKVNSIRRRQRSRRAPLVAAAHAFPRRPQVGRDGARSGVGGGGGGNGGDDNGGSGGGRGGVVVPEATTMAGNAATTAAAAARPWRRWPRWPGPRPRSWPR